MKIKEPIIKSPLNYAGNKYRLLKQILPFFPERIKVFVDLFGGSGTVGPNVNCDRIIYNEYDAQVFSVVKMLATTSPQQLLADIQNKVSTYGLSKDDSSGYVNLKTDYNSNPDSRTPLELYLLSCYSFSNIIRFNADNEFNVPFGQRQFSVIMKKNIPLFYNFFNSRPFEFYNLDFEEVEIPDNAFVYLDPPYLGAGAVYNERGGWTEAQEKRLYAFIDRLSERGIKWALSNDLSKNKYILEWARSKGYNVFDIDADYSRSSYQTNRELTGTEEVLITNYNIEVSQ